MKKFIGSFVAIGLLAASVAHAGPIHATFDGSVTGWNGLNNAVLSSFPIGTSASFDVTFDDSGLLPTEPLTDYDLAPVSGSVRLGAQQWTLTGGHIPSYTYDGTTGAIISYGLQLTGTGPTNSGGASLYGLFLRLTPDLSPFNATSLSVGFAYPTSGGEFYSYANVGEGEFSAGRVVSVAEPNSALLLLPAAFMFLRSRRKNAASAQETSE